MKLVCGNLFLRGPLAKQSMGRRVQPRGHRLLRRVCSDQSLEMTVARNRWVCGPPWVVRG